MKHRLGLALIIVGAGIEVLSMVSKQGTISSNADLANTQAKIVNFNEMLGSTIHVSYVLIVGGLVLRYL